MKKTLHLQPKSVGALAQLARALDWQSKGHGFDSHTLHFKFYKALQMNILQGFFNDVSAKTKMDLAQICPTTGGNKEGNE